MKHDESDAERIIRVEGDLSTLKGSVSSIQATLTVMNDRLSSIGKPNWMLWVSVFGVSITFFSLTIGAMFYFIKSDVANQIAPVSLKAATSEMDRHKLNDQVLRNSDSISEVRQLLMVNSMSEKEKGVERETQNRALAQFANMRHAHYMQLFGLLWQQQYGQPLPQNYFYPDISFSKPHGN